MKRIVEFVAMVGNHNLHNQEGKLVINWNEHVKGKDASEIVVLCSEIYTIGRLYWTDKATQEEKEELLTIKN